MLTRRRHLCQFSVAIAFCIFGCSTASAVMNVLFVTANNGSLTALESGRVGQIQSWGYTVNTIWSGASQATFDAAFANNRAVYLPDESTEANVSYKLRQATIGVFSEHPALAMELGFCSSNGTTTSASTINITNNTHYVTSVFPTGSFTLGSSTYNVVKMVGTSAPGATVLATVGGTNSILAVDTGGTLANTYNGSNVAFGRRVQFPLPISVNDGSTFSANTFTMAQRMMNWAASLDHTLVGYWKLNETSGTAAADSSGLSTSGTVTGTTNWTSAALNNGFQFDGNTKIQVTGMFSNPKNVSVAAWAKLTTPDTGGSEIISLGDHFYIRLDEGGVAKAVMYTGSAYQSVSFSGTYAGTGWHHFAAVFDDDNNLFKLYIDGALAASASNTNSISYTGLGANTIIGRNGNAATTNDFTGTIDDVRVYNYAISANEVAQLYGLVGQWKMNQNSGATATDSTVLARNQALTGTAHWSNDCGGMRTFAFDGSTNYFSAANTSDFQPTGMVSLSAWVYGNSWGTGTTVNTVIRKGEASPNNYALQIANGKVEFLLNGSDGSGIQGGTTLNTGQWYWIAATWDGTTAKVYVNGVLDNSPGTAKAAPISTDTRPLYIGGRASAGYFNGMIRDVRIYNRPLLAEELYAGAGLVGWWKFAEGSGTSAADSSPFANNATLSGGATWTSDCTGNNNALLTNGSGGIAQTAVPFDPPSTGTVTFWMRSTGAPAGATARIIGQGADWEIRQNNDGRVISDLSGDGATTIGTVTPLTEVGRWYHFAATFDATDNSYAIYVDGKSELSGINTVTLVKQPRAPISFGIRAGTTDYWSGGLRDVRIYNRKLCPAEIEAIYGLVGYWKMDETTGTTAADSSGMGLDGTVTGTAPTWTAGKISNAIQLNGANHVEVNSLMGSPRNATIAAWANLTAPDSGGAELVSIGNYFAIRLNEGTTAKAFFYNGTTWLNAGITQSYTGAGWHHFAAVFNDDADSLTFYVDGLQQAQTSTTASIVYSGQGTKTEIGAHGNGQTTYDFTGKIDDVRIYNRALCPTDIMALRNAGGTFGGVKVIKWVEAQ